MDHDTNLRRRYAMSNLKSNTGLDKSAPPLLRSDSKAIIHASVDMIDIPEWLFALTDTEYQQCSIAHIAGAEKQHCRLVSLSDMFIQQQHSKMQLAWDMTVKPLSNSSCEFTNSIFLFETDALLAFFENGDAPPEQARDALQRALDAHNDEETPNFAKSIERRTVSTVGIV